MPYTYPVTGFSPSKLEHISVTLLDEFQYFINKRYNVTQGLMSILELEIFIPNH